MPFTITPYDERHRPQILTLSLRAWRPVFEKFEPAVPAYVYRAFYPNGWEARQTADIETILSDESERKWVACDADRVVGWVGVRLHAEDSMGEIHILAVDADRQREGIGRALLDTAFAYLRTTGMQIVLVETGDDPGHAASRSTYEHCGFERWPVARYFRKL